MNSGRVNRGPAAAVENRAAIIRAAAEVFSQEGLDAPLNAIAKRAGVGQGSLYRHFPTRESLAFAVIEVNLGRLEAVVTGGGGLADVLDVVTEQALVGSALMELVVRHTTDPRSTHLEQRLRDVLSSVIDTGRRTGTIPSTFTIDDVLLTIMLISGSIARTLPKNRPELVERAWEIMGVQLHPLG